ncbi:hypothetical protein LCGC14_3058140, partial [marine sediment metagenome]
YRYSIKRLTIKGYKGVVGDLFVNSNIAADYIGTLQLRDATLDNDGTPFGVAANTLNSLKLRRFNQVGGKSFSYKWDKTTSTWIGTPTLAAQDLTVRLKTPTP